MLVLSRKLQQQIKIGDQITVTILRVKGNTVRIGVEAPREVRVVRGELPKSENTDDLATSIVVEARVCLGDDDKSEAAESSEECAAQQAGASQENHSPTPLAAAHLPLRQVRHRYGRGPLRQLITSTSALAK